MKSGVNDGVHGGKVIYGPPGVNLQICSNTKVSLK